MPGVFGYYSKYHSEPCEFRAARLLAATDEELSRREHRKRVKEALRTVGRYGLSPRNALAAEPRDGASAEEEAGNASRSGASRGRGVERPV